MLRHERFRDEAQRGRHERGWTNSLEQSCGTWRERRRQLRRMKRSADVDPRFRDVAAAFAATPGVARTRMMSSDCLTVDGRIFAMFGRDRFVVKLPKTRVDALIAAESGERFTPGHGRAMKEWIVVTSAPQTWPEFAREAFAYVRATAATSPKRR